MPTEMIPEGYYNAVAVPREGEDGSHIARWGVAGEKKTKQVLIYFEITDGEWAGHVLPWFGYFSKAAAKRTVESLRYCGFKGDDLFDLDNQALDQGVNVLVEHNEYDGKTYARIAFVNASGGGAIQLKSPMNEKSIREFAAVMKQSCAKVPEHEGEPVKAGSNGKGQGGVAAQDAAQDAPDERAGDPLLEDDIPF